MRIETPQLTRTDGRVRIASDIQLDITPEALPQRFRVWYELPLTHANHLSRRGDAFVVALLCLAMNHAEDIHVESVLSPQLEWGLREYQRIFGTWFDDFTPIQIMHEGLEAPSAPSDPTGKAVFFSGGVDSFFSLWSHLPQNMPNPEHQVTHGLFIEGFDTRSANSIRRSRNAYQTLFQKLGMTLIPVRTNLKEIVNDETVGWRAAHGTFLMSIPILLQHLLQRCYVPSTKCYATLFDHTSENPFADRIFGSNPFVDHLLSTEALSVIHDGAWATRSEKVAAIADWSAVYDHLYVCIKPEGNHITNCCQCEKCIRTMIAFEIAGTLDQFTTFPEPLRRSTIRGWHMPDYQASKPFVLELREFAQSEDRDDIVQELRFVMAKHRFQNSGPGRLAREFVYEPARQSARRLYHRYLT